MNTKLIDTYPNPMDGYHPKDQHMCTHIEALGHLEPPNSVLVGSDMEFEG